MTHPKDPQADKKPTRNESGVGAVPTSIPRAEIAKAIRPHIRYLITKKGYRELKRGKTPKDSENMAIDEILALFQAHQQELLDRVEKEVIGEDEHTLKVTEEYTNDRQYLRNELRAKQRTTIKKLREGLHE